MYLLVEFTDNNEIAVIPDNWLNGTSCAVWPTQIRSTAKLNNAVMEKTEPDNTWPAYPIRELYKNDSYSAVRSKLKKAELESDVGTTADSSSDDGVNSTSRRSKRKRRERTFSSDEEETCIYPLNKKKNLPKPPNPLDLNVSATSPFQQILLTPPSTLNNSTGCVTSSSRRLQMPQSTDTSMSSASNICIDSIDSILPNIETMLPTTPRTVSKIMSSPSTSKIDCTARDLRMFTMLENISQEQKVQRDILNSIICRLNAADATTTAEIPEELVFPVSSIEHLEKTEEILSADNTVFKGLINYLSVVGGRTRTDMCKRVMRHVLTNEMGKFYNWYGKKNKRAFNKLKLSVAVQKAVIKVFTCTASEVEIDCREWFRTSSDRDGGRKRRANTNPETTETTETTENTEI